MNCQIQSRQAGELTKMHVLLFFWNLVIKFQIQYIPTKPCVQNNKYLVVLKMRKRRANMMEASYLQKMLPSNSVDFHQPLPLTPQKKVHYLCLLLSWDFGG